MFSLFRRSLLVLASVFFLGGSSFFVGSHPKVTLAASKTATLNLSPASGSYIIGSQVAVNVKLTSTTEAISGVEVTINYPAGLLRFDSADGSGSIFTTELTPASVIGTNTIFLSRARLDTGYLGTAGQVVRLNFSSLAAGSPAVSIDMNTSQAGAYSDGGNALQSVSGASYTVTNPVASTPKPTPKPSTAKSSATATPSPSATATATPATPIPTLTPTLTPTDTAAITGTPTPTILPSPTATPTPQATGRSYSIWTLLPLISIGWVLSPAIILGPAQVVKLIIQALQHKP